MPQKRPFGSLQRGLLQQKKDATFPQREWATFNCIYEEPTREQVDGKAIKTSTVGDKTFN